MDARAAPLMYRCCFLSSFYYCYNCKDLLELVAMVDVDVEVYKYSDENRSFLTTIAFRLKMKVSLIIS